MSFTAKVKEEIINNELNSIENKFLYSSYIKYSVKSSKNLNFTFDNPALARKIYKYLSDVYNIKAQIILRIQKRFKTKRIYILNINSNQEKLLKSCNIKIIDNKIHNESFNLKTLEEMKSYIQGAFLACGSINDPSTSGYHLEMVFVEKKSADLIKKLFHEFNVNAKTLKRGSHYMVYVKVADEISDILKIMNVNKALFYFEDIRTKKDHVNMVNRLNNCEQANQDKTIKTGIEQLEEISYLEEHDLINLLDEKTQLVITYRKKYPEISYQELANVISLESGYNITKSGINHHFIKIRNLSRKHKEKSTVK